jgi:hypothetical protein
LPAVHTPPQDVHENDFDVKAGIEATSVGTSPVKALSHILMSLHVDTRMQRCIRNKIPKLENDTQGDLGITGNGVTWQLTPD